MTQIAMCRCGVPLVATFAFARYEFYCLDCGDHLGWLEPGAADETPELVADMDARKAEWVENAGRKLLVHGAWNGDCDRCRLGGESHVQHATDAEREADAAAREWIRSRLVGAHA